MLTLNKILYSILQLFWRLFRDYLRVDVISISTVNYPIKERFFILAVSKIVQLRDWRRKRKREREKERKSWRDGEEVAERVINQT